MSDFTVTVTDPDRAAEWQRVLGATTMPVRSPIPSLANLPGLGERSVYLLDLDQITTEQRQRLVEHISQKFGLDPAEVEADLANPEHGVPILADDCTIAVHNPQKWFD